MCNSLWEFDKNHLEEKTTDNITNITRQQCQYLKQETSGKVLAKFARIKLINPIQKAFETLTYSPVLSQLNTPKESVGDTDTMNLKDANELYVKARYGFEIYNKSYKFRVFELQMEPVYPIELLLDEGIGEEVRGFLEGDQQITDYTKYKVDSDEDFIRYLGIILKSRKVRYIVNRMYSMSD